MPQSLDALITDMLQWIAEAPRGYGEVMEQWRTSCPQLTVWEDAVDRGLVARGYLDGHPQVHLTDAGRDFLARNRA